MKLIRRAVAGLLVLAFVLTAAGCGKKEDGKSDKGNTPQNQTDHTQADPVTLEQVLLKERGKEYDQSDYKKFIGGEGIITPYAEFDCSLDHAYSKTVDDIVISDGKIYKANFNNTLSNGKNIQEIGTLPESGPVSKWYLTYDGEMGLVYFKSGSCYELLSSSANGPYTSRKRGAEDSSMFNKVYCYASDGKTLEDKTQSFLKADHVYDYGTAIIVFLNEKVYLLFPGKYLDTGSGFNFNMYRDMGLRQYIAFLLDTSEMGKETPIRLFNNNIIMTNSAFYEIVYASKPLDENDEKTQLAPDGSASPYYPAYEHLNCNARVRKIELLSAFYGDVRNISTSHVITDDYTLIPINEVMNEGYSEYMKYDCRAFYWDYSKEN